MFNVCKYLYHSRPLTNSLSGLYWELRIDLFQPFEVAFFKCHCAAVSTFSWPECREWRGSADGGEVRGDEVCWVFVGLVHGAQCPYMYEDGELVMSWLAGPKNPLSLWRRDMIGTKRRVAGIVLLNQSVTGGSSPAWSQRNTNCQSLMLGKTIYLRSFKLAFLVGDLVCSLWLAYTV